MKRLLSLLASACLLGSVLLIWTATPVFATYNQSCVGTTQDQNNEHVYIERTSGLTYTGARGEENVGYYLACTSGITGVGKDLDVLATVEGDSGAGWNEAQCFVGNLTNRGTHFWFTPDNNGVLYPFGPTPHFNSHVTCSITSVMGCSGTCPLWKYTLTDSYSGTTTIEYSNRAGTGGKRAWWGYEVGNDGDEMGGQGSGGSNYIQYPGYWYVGGGGSLWYATGDLSGDLFHCCSSQGAVMRCWWHISVSGIGSAGYDSIRGYTDSTHSC